MYSLPTMKCHEAFLLFSDILLNYRQFNQAPSNAIYQLLLDGTRLHMSPGVQTAHLTKMTRVQ